MRFSALTQRLLTDDNDAWRVHQLATARVARGDDVIVLSLGDPDVAAPAAVVAAVHESLGAGHTSYTPSPGEGRTREAVAAHLTRLAGRRLTGERVVFVPGTQTALFATFLAICDPGDEVIIPAPGYATYPGVMAASGARIVPVTLDPGRRFHPEPGALAAAVTGSTRAILLTNPHNPTGHVVPEATLAAIGELCRARDLWLVADEVYALLSYAPFASVLSLHGLDERVVSLGSVSKSHAMTGFRAGWLAGPEELVRRVTLMLDAMLFGCPPFVQAATVAALTDEAAGAAAKTLYRSRAAVVCAALETTPGIVPIEPEGGMFVLVDIRPTRLGGDEFALRLLDEADVSVLPTDAFGAPGHVRIGLVADDDRLREACTRIDRFARALAAAA